MSGIAEGQKVEVQGSAAKPYVLTNAGDAFVCTCPAWRNQPIPVEKRTCKHLVGYLGVEYERSRLGVDFPERLAKKKAASKRKRPALLLAENWDTATDISGWWMSEKLDGIRALWDGSRFLSRQGNEFLAPKWYVEGFPAVPLDGELWMGRKVFQKTSSIVRRKTADKAWETIQYRVFDAPSEKQPFEERMALIQEQFSGLDTKYLRFHEHVRCEGVEHLKTELARLETLGGEGLMLREPASIYEVGRSFTLLKVKNFHDAEAVVIGRQAGKGKHKGKLGALRVRLEDGTEFSIGTGFREAERIAPPPIGAVITFRYQEFTDGGVPRFASFLRVRENSTNLSASAGVQSASAVIDEQFNQEVREEAPVMKRFEYEDEKVKKFWEISRDGCDVLVHYGRVGADGQKRTRKLETVEEAQKHVETMIREKTRKGYKEC